MATEQSYNYLIVGGGLAGTSAAEGIRGHDKKGSVLLIGNERHLPYDRPPLTKKLWFGQKTVEDIYLHNSGFYEENNIKLELGIEIVAIDGNRKTATDNKGNIYRYEKLLLATGGTPRILPIPGGDTAGICYYRYLDDYLRIRSEAAEGKSAVIVGGGFIGSEMAAALSINKMDVTMLFPDSYICARVFPEYLGMTIQKRFMENGVRMLTGEKPVSFAKNGKRFVTRTESGKEIESDILIVGIGIAPSIKLAEGTGLQTGNGIIVNEFLQTSNPDIFAAGDIARFPYQALGEEMRVEHWDNALNQGKWAGRNMAGANEPFSYMPYFFSDLFEFGYEAVGEVDARLETFADWKKENEEGVVYYLKNGKVRGVMMCNVWEKVDVAREIIREGEEMTPEKLRGLIR